MQHYWNRFVGDVDKDLCRTRVVSQSVVRFGGDGSEEEEEEEEDP